MSSLLFNQRLVTLDPELHGMFRLRPSSDPSFAAGPLQSLVRSTESIQ